MNKKYLEDLAKLKPVEEKTELEKVEFAVADDVSKLHSKATDAALEADKLKQKAQAAYAEAAELSLQAETLAEKGVAAAKELGAKQLVKDLQSSAKYAKQRAKRYSQAESKLKAVN